MLNEDRALAVQRAMGKELKRAMGGVHMPGHPKPFFLSYLLHAREGLSVWGRYGAVFRTEPFRDTDLYAEIRVGSHRFDNTIDGGLTADLSQFPSYPWTEGPQELDPDALRYAFWKLTQHKYEEALQQFYEKKKILVEQRLRHSGPNFSREPRLRHRDPIATANFSTKRWEGFVRRISAELRRYRGLEDPYVQIRGVNQVRIFVSSEGSQFICQERYYEVVLQAYRLADDGVQLESTRHFYGRDPSDLPSETRVKAALEDMAQELAALAKAKPLAPYAGPALLSGLASGLIFHEAIGHRLEGERMGSRNEGQTFATKLGQRVLPAGIDIVDDPTRSHFEGVPLHGHYHVDDEGVRAQPVTLVRDGVLQSFLMSRSLVEGYKQSNGHARHERFQDPMARMANLIVTARGGLDWDTLKERLMQETRDRGLPHGILVRGVSGGETRTDHYDFQAFKGIPTGVYTVDPRTGKETRVRDVAFIGTPLAVMQRILAMGDRPEVDNAYCYAESGAVPVATVAPAMLVGDLELQRASTRSYRKPRLPMPRL